MLKHQNDKHSGEEPNFKASVTARTRDCLARQVREAVLIRRSQVPVLNGKCQLSLEYNMRWRGGDKCVAPVLGQTESSFYLKQK